MRNYNIHILFVVFLLASVNVLACWYDTGWKTFKQPNGVEFVARMYGDEYESFFETKEGYSLEKNYSDGYYYYASNSLKGHFILTNLKVGMDKPRGLPKRLVKTNPLRMRQMNDNHHNSLNKKNNSSDITSTTYTLKVVLIEFQDIHGRNYYTRADFENMLDGSNYSTSPDDEDTYGSMKQYYDRMTDGDIIVDATVLNNSSGNDLPIWVRVAHDKMDYKNNYYDIFDDAYAASIAAGYDLSYNATTKIVFIYAGNYYGDGLNPQGTGYGYLMCEIWAGRPNYNSEGTVENGYTFAHIGIHCHELGHHVGVDDIHNIRHGLDWSLMGDGCDLGESYKGQCPAPIDPVQRYYNGWISVQTPSIPNTGVNFVYDGENPTVYRIESGWDVFYIENRRFEDYSRFCPGYSSHPNGGGLLIWHDDISIWVLEADGVGTLFGDYGDLFPGSTENRNINDFTTVDWDSYYTDNLNLIMHDVSDPGATMTAVLGNKWFGELPQDLTWAGSILVGGDVTVPSDISLQIDAETSIGLESGTSIIVNGTLEANGESNDHVVLNRSGATGTWGGIKFNSGSSGTLEYCEISNATYGVRADNGADVYIKNCEIEDNSYGIYGYYYADLKITGNYIHDNTYGVQGSYGSTAKLFGNVIEDNSSYGIVGYYGAIF